MRTLLRKISIFKLLIGGITLPECVLAEYDPFEMVLDKEEVCLALNIYHEARGEPLAGQVAVAHVTLNRVEDEQWPNTICEVVYQPSQFSWTISPPKVLEKGFLDMLVIARKVLYNIYQLDPSHGAVFYHKADIAPCWLTDVEYSVRIDNHIFYKKNGSKTNNCKRKNNNAKDIRAIKH